MACVYIREVAMARTFYIGRSESIRVVTEENVAFVRASREVQVS